MFTRTINPDLSLALIDPKFAIDYVEILKKDKEYLGKWLDFANQNGLDKQDFYLDFIKECLAQFANSTGYPCVIIYREKVAGNVIFNSINKKTGSADLGYWIRSDLQGKGITTQAVQAMIDIGFNELDITRIQIRCATENYASRAIPKKLGFSLEGIIRRAACIGGQTLDYEVYSLTQAEYSDINR